MGIDGYGTGNEDNVTVNVLNGASVTGDDFGIYLDENATIINDGTITGLNDSGIDATDLVLTNRGTIVSPLSSGVVATDLISLNNSGVIDGRSNGVIAFNNPINSLFNSGAIIGRADDGINLFNGDLISLTNTSTGIISGGNDGIDIDGTIIELINHGAITGQNANGINADAIGILTNSGTITGLRFNGINAGNITRLTNTSTGRISGAAIGVNVSGVIGELINDGTITGGNVHGVDADSITKLTNSGTINGDNDGINVDSIGTLFNSGTIIGQTDDGIQANTITSLTNTESGTITANDTGVFAGPIGSLTNSGTITGGTNGIIGADITSLINSGTIAGQTGEGVSANEIASLINSGTITGGDEGIVGTIITSLINESGGTISGGNNGINASALVSLINRGLITGGTFAILSNFGDDTIDNFGTVTGNVDLGGGANAFFNRAGGLFNAGPTVNLGAGNFLNNAGTLSPGGLNTPLTTALDGNYLQSATGIFNTDVDFANLVGDRLDVTGTAMLDGLVVANFFNPQAVTPGQQGQVTILTAAGGVTDNGITAQDTAVVDLTLLFIGNDRVDLTTFIDFAPDGLNKNQTALGENVNAIQEAGGAAAFAPVVAGLLVLPELADLADAYDQLGPEIYLDNGIATLFSSLDFADDLMSCEVREGGNVFINEGQCIWAKGSGAWFDQDKTGETIAFDRDAIRFAAGGQVAIAPDWRVGMAIGYEHSTLDALGGRQTSNADTLHGGAVIKYLFGDGLLSAAISGGQGWYDTTRNLAFGGFAAQSTADHDVSHLTGRLRGAYAFTNGVHYIKPMVDLNISYIDIEGFTEAGGGGAALIVNGTDETVFSVSPAVEFGWQSALADGILLRPYVRAGVTVFDDPELVLTSRFAAVNGAPSFRTAIETDDVVGDIAAGLDVLTNDGSVIKVYYAGQFGEDTEQQSVGAKVNLPF